MTLKYGNKMLQNINKANLPSRTHCYKISRKSKQYNQIFVTAIHIKRQKGYNPWFKALLKTGSSWGQGLSG